MKACNDSESDIDFGDGDEEDTCGDSCDRARLEDGAALRRSIADFTRPKGRDLLARTKNFLEWQDLRRHARVWPYARSLDGGPVAVTRLSYDDGVAGKGINFASQDYLSLATHEAVQEAAIRAVRDFGVHSAGSAMLAGNCRISLELERALSELLGRSHVLLFPSGSSACMGTICALVKTYDHVIIDEHAHPALLQAARAATTSIARFRHNDADACDELLRRIRQDDARNGVLVITEALFSVDSDSPRLAALAESCRAYGASLLADVTHDLGATGPNGTGQLGLQKMLGAVDLVVGSLSGTFASNGGFLATSAREVKEYVRVHGGSHALSSALSPVQSAVALEAVRIVRSKEGDGLRAALAGAVAGLRAALAARGVHCLGDPSPIVPIEFSSESVARLASWLVFQRGCLVNLVEYPSLSSGTGRFRMQVQAAHTPGQVEWGAKMVADAIHEAEAQLD